ncbi:MAG: transcriptional repressor LexA [Xanthomonadales bacterium]|nr:transcriptional repressor LexA [Xanthomonadales bacterium]
MKLSPTQQSILELIAERIDEEGMPPSQTEIARAMGFKGVRAAQYHLDALEQAGAIERVPGRARGIRLSQPWQAPQRSLQLAAPAEDTIRLPVLGRVAAGAPIGSGAEDIDPDGPSVLLDPQLFDPIPDYLLRVQGQSMRDEGILDGDLVGVRRTAEARSGEVVVARLDEEITIKVLRCDEDAISLLPSNPAYEPIVVSADQDFAIEGIYCGLLRPGRSR